MAEAARKYGPTVRWLGTAAGLLIGKVLLKRGRDMMYLGDGVLRYDDDKTVTATASELRMIRNARARGTVEVIGGSHPDLAAADLPKVIADTGLTL